MLHHSVETSTTTERFSGIRTVRFLDKNPTGDYVVGPLAKQKSKARSRPNHAPGVPVATLPGALSLRSWPTVFTAAALVILTVAAYSGVQRLDFIPLDDQGYVYENAHVTAGLTVEGVRWAFTTGEQANWHPLTWLSHMLDVQFFGLNAQYHHLVNLAIHTLSAVLLFLLLARTTGALGRSAFVAALFAVHPLHVESVAWVAERKDVLSTFFWLLTMAAYVWYARAPGRWRYAAVVASLALGLLSKPMLVTLPFALLLIDVWPLGRFPLASGEAGGRGPEAREARVRTALALIREKIPLYVLAVCSSVVTVVFQSRGGAVSSIDTLPMGVRLTNALTSYVAYLEKTVWPAGLAVFYPYSRSIPLWQWLGSLAILAGITWLVVRAGRRRPYLPVGWFWYLGTLVPVIGLIQVGRQSMADRYTYIPLIGVFMIVAWGVPDAIARWPGRRYALATLAGAIAIACTATTHAQVAHWRDAWTLWTHTLAVTRDNEPAQSAIGAILGAQGRNEEAVAHFREALRIAPDSPRAHRGIGLALTNLGQLDEAVEHLSLAVDLEPNSADGHDNLGVALAGQGRPGEAILHYLEALRLDPNRAATHRSLGLALMMLGRADEAAAHYREAIRLRPDFAEAHNELGFTLMTLGLTGEAKTQFREALRLQPALAEAHDNLGFALASEGHGDDALPHLLEAVRLKPGFELAHLHLGMALGATGRLDEAAREFQEVLHLNPNNADAKRLLDRISRPARGR
jgi:tetratricopeptide (TPR) repeat protein